MENFNFKEILMTHTVTHIGWQLAALPVTASSCPLCTGEKTQRTGGEARLPNRCAVLLFRWCVLPYLRHEVPHGYSCLILFLASGVGVGAEGEPGVVVSQHGVDGLDIDAVLECQGGEGVP